VKGNRESFIGSSELEEITGSGTGTRLDLRSFIICTSRQILLSRANQ
jgi:hypothetical protein